MNARPTIERFKLISSFLLRRPMNATQLAQKLEVSTKTIHRDLEFMRDRIGLPIEYDYAKNGYKFTRSVPLCACCGGGGKMKRLIGFLIYGPEIAFFAVGGAVTWVFECLSRIWK